jgi:putative spermidine/putrescine transport system substrate-binding protein
MMPSRRQFVLGASAAATSAIAGCTGGNDGDSGGGGSGEQFEVGYGDSATTVNAANFPEKLFVYAVQTGWSNWEALMTAFENRHGVALNDDQRSSGEALTDARSNAQDPTHSGMNGGYTFGVIARNEGLTQP